MDRELQYLGAFGIVREAFNVLLSSSRSKLLWLLTVTLILPLSFASLGQDFINDRLLLEIENKFNRNEMVSLRELTSKSTELFVFQAAYLIFTFNISLLWTAAAYTAASIYTAKQVSYAKFISVWKRLTVSLLWLCTIVLVLTVAYILGFSLFIYAVGFDKYAYFRDFFLCSIPMLAVIFCVHVYVNMLWYLACVISVLEDKYDGLEAMRKSKDLIKGKQITALALVILYFMVGRLIEWIFRLFQFSVTYGDLRGVGRTARIVCVALLLGLLCLVNLMWLLIQSVFYFVCKAYHHEKVADKSFSLGHPVVYLDNCVEQHEC